ncbi:MAG TPA: dipicolinate synthase subunit B [Candidatus Alectryocaccomicrobium excrementavium]|uniref:Dipicolinate synthase subunit B n=1 Tax=Candidatus Alectryocaccomicrobium excrementavium TaxID=2840668 RepID=A0A9D1G309_9FIRM|nr:dipicolinate synthase subunit B [Candidatus Alectryocaccomicrobium excrementavium]
MRELAGARVGCAMTGSFCTFRAAFDAWRALKQTGAEMYPIFSENAYSFDTRFYTAEKAREEMREICGRDIWHSIVDVEPIGPKKLLDLLIIAPCTGNTLGKLAHAITDTAVTMAAKAQLRNGRPVLLAISTNDGLSQSAKNIGALMPVQNIFFVPFRQDDPVGKPSSLVADLKKLPLAAQMALNGHKIEYMF